MRVDMRTDEVDWVINKKIVFTIKVAVSDLPASRRDLLYLKLSDRYRTLEKVNESSNRGDIPTLP